MSTQKQVGRELSSVEIYHLIFRFSLFLHQIFAIFFMLIRLQINIMITYDLHLRYLFRHQICFMARMQKCELKQGYRNVMCVLNNNVILESLAKFELYFLLLIMNAFELFTSKRDPKKPLT